MKYADLHIHTNFSDGTFSPQQVVAQAHKQGLACIAITDHDEVGACGAVIKEASNFNIEVIPGVELTTEIDGYEIHILGYCIDWQSKWFNDKLKQICDVRRKRALTIIEKLKTQGINLNPDELLRQSPHGSVGRLHIARMLKNHGFVYSIQEAFNKYIGNGRPCCVKKFKLTPAETINMIYRVKGVAVLAHPYNIGNDEIIAEFVQLGLKGIEVYYPEHDQATIERYQDLAKKYGLLITGGSDCHGLVKNKALIGAVKIPYKLVERLKEEAKRLKDAEE